MAIGTCTVRAGKDLTPLAICPSRLLAHGQVFTDVLHLLTRHEPGNEYHVVREVGIPGGSVDFVVVSVQRGKPVDFVGVEFQTLDTTGTVWPARQAFLASQGLIEPSADARSFGINWKMTAKTILMQLHHKVETFESVNRHLVLVVQDKLMEYMEAQFSFEHLANGAVGDSLHFHSYALHDHGTEGLSLELAGRKSTDVAGIAKALELGQTGRLALDDLFGSLAAKISDATRWNPAA